LVRYASSLPLDKWSVSELMPERMNPDKPA
jgi:hypothetical protein